VAYLLHMYRKFPTRVFLSLSLVGEVILKLCFFTDLGVGLPLIYESRVDLISLLRFDDLRSKVNYFGLTGLLLLKSLFSIAITDSLRAFLIFLIPWIDIDKFIKNEMTINDIIINLHCYLKWACPKR